MFSRLFLRGDIVKGCSVNHAQVGSYLSQTISSFKPTITRALHLARDVRIFTASKIQLSNLRSGVCKQNGKFFAKGSSRDFASTRQQSDSLNINTDVTNNVYLYKYDRPRFFNIMNVSGIIQLFIWLGIAYAFTMQLPKRDPDTTPWKKYLFDNLLIVAAIPLSTLAGIGGSLLMWAYAARSVRYLILNKGGKDVTLITYHPLNKTITTVPVSSLNCPRSRKEMGNYLPVKMRGRPFFYILDRSGEFVNPTLFDYTVGAKKK